MEHGVMELLKSLLQLNIQLIQIISLNNVEFVGESREGTKIVYDAVESTINPVTGSQYVLNCATIHVNVSGFITKNISIYNDFDYKNNQYNLAYVNVKESSPQCLALILNGDMLILDNCHLYGNQDTLYIKSGCTYVKDDIVEGEVDTIFSAPLILDFKGGTFAILIEDIGVTYVKKGDIDASTSEQIVNNVTLKNCKANGADNWLKISSTTEITFKVSRPYIIGYTVTITFAG